MEFNFIDEVYLSLTGDLCEEYRVPGVEDLYAEGAPCDLLYAEMRGAYERLLDRLGCVDDDEDLDIMVRSLSSICEITGHAMYRYGKKFAAQDKTTHAK